MKRTCILIVDDVVDNLVAMEALLARPERELILARSATEALECLLTHEVALVLLDVQMPGMDGFELARLMQGVERTAEIPLIFLTAASKDPLRTAEGYRHGAVDFLYKPLDPHILQSKVAVFVDLYEQRRDLAARLEDLDHALRMNERFAAVLGHDLRNPLAAIAAGAELLLRNPDPATVGDIAARIKSSSQRMATMVERLLGVARLRAGTLKVTFDEIDMGELTRTIVDEFDQPGEHARIEVDTRGSLLLKGDRGALGQVLSNLVGNALKHGEADTPVWIELDGSDADELLLTVRNRGRLPEGVHARLSKPFATTRSTAPSVGGSDGAGLGLYIVSQLVALHGGRLDLHSEPATGTAVRCALPRSPRPAP